MHKIVLRNGNREFSTWSTHTSSQIGNIPQFDRVIFFIHGFPDNNNTFNEVITLISRKLGPRVLCLAPLLRGYEPSSFAEDHEYRISDIAGDIRAWILQLVPKKEVPVHLVGHDWGAIATFKTAQLYPDIVTSAVALAIPYLANLRAWHYLFGAPKQLYYSTYFITMQHPFLYRQKFGDVRKPGGYLDSLWAYWSPNWDFTAAIESVRETLAQPGVLDAATAYYRNLFRLRSIKELRWTVDFDKVPTLIAGGSQDGCMTSDLYKLETKLLASESKACVRLFDGVGHFLQRENPQLVADAVAEWIAQFPNYQ